MPAAYRSGAPLADTDFWKGATFASLHLTPGFYSETIGTGAQADTLSIRVGPNVPAPGPLMTLAAGLLLRGAARRATAPDRQV